MKDNNYWNFNSMDPDENNVKILKLNERQERMFLLLCNEFLVRFLMSSNSGVALDEEILTHEQTLKLINSLLNQLGYEI